MFYPWLVAEATDFARRDDPRSRPWRESSADDGGSGVSSEKDSLSLPAVLRGEITTNRAKRFRAVLSSVVLRFRAHFPLDRRFQTVDHFPSGAKLRRRHDGGSEPEDGEAENRDPDGRENAQRRARQDAGERGGAADHGARSPSSPSSERRNTRGRRTSHPQLADRDSGARDQRRSAQNLHCYESLGDSHSDAER